MEYEGGNPPTCRDSRAKLHGKILQASLEVTVEQEWAKLEKLDTTVIISMGTVAPAADEGTADAASGTYVWRYHKKMAKAKAEAEQRRAVGQTFRYCIGNKTKTFWYCSQISFIENRLFQFRPESALLGLIERISFDNTNSGKNSIVFCFIPFKSQNVCGMFVPLLF
jgi:hypothetical protein